LIPSTDEALSFALSLSGDEFAVLDTLQRLGVPDASTIIIAGSFIRVGERATRHTLGVSPFTNSVGSTRVGIGRVGASALASFSVGIPGTLSVILASLFGGVASSAASNTLVDVVLAHGVTVTFSGVFVHGRASFSTTLGLRVVLASRSGRASFRSLGEVTAEHFALVVGVDAAHTKINAALRSLGVSGVDGDLVARGLANIFVVVPHAASVVLAVALGGVDEGALSLASHLGAVIDAVGVDSASCGVTDLRADLSTLSTIPLALRIRLAVVFRSTSGAGNRARSSDRLLTVKARITVTDELTLSFTTVAAV